MRTIYNLIVSLILASLLLSCNDEPKINNPSVRQTMLVYIIATNDLSGFNDIDINEMMAGMMQVDNGRCNLLVYETDYNNDPTLYSITANGGVAKKNVIKTYSPDVRSTTVERMSEVVNDARSIAPADIYGLVLWSHADGWVRRLESNYANASSQSISPRDFGNDYGEKMPITNLAKALPDNMFHFIYADACYMGSIEIAYQLRNKTRYYISSPTETMSTGMPYDENIPCMFEETPNLLQACINEYEYYNSRDSYVTISLVDCSKLDALAEICREIHHNGNSNEVPTDGLQYYNRNSQPIFFDFMQYTQMLATDEQATKLKELADDAIIYKAATPNFMSITINPEHYSGLSTHILGTSSSINENYYKTLDWYNKIYK